MNVNLLIDSIVRQTTILIAHLATATGGRSPLAHTANQVFADLLRELKEQGLGNKVIADMFGLSLRTYHNKVRRMSESSTERGQTLWEAVLRFIQQNGTVMRSDVQQRFCRDDEVLVRGVLRDLVESGILFQSGIGERLTYRLAEPEELNMNSYSARDVEADLVWVAINRYEPISAKGLRDVIPVHREKLDAAIERLLAEKRIRVRESQGEDLYECDECLIPINASYGWEAAVLDHYQAMVTAICTKLRQGKTRAEKGEAIGGSTYCFEVYENHPLQDEVLGFLESTRKRAQDLRKRVDAHNEKQPVDERFKQRVYAYVGQTIIQSEERDKE